MIPNRLASNREDRSIVDSLARPRRPWQRGIGHAPDGWRTAPPA